MFHEMTACARRARTCKSARVVCVRPLECLLKQLPELFRLYLAEVREQVRLGKLLYDIKSSLHVLQICDSSNCSLHNRHHESVVDNSFLVHWSDRYDCVDLVHCERDHII